MNQTTKDTEFTKSCNSVFLLDLRDLRGSQALRRLRVEERLLLFENALLLQDLTRDAKRFDTCGNPGIDRDWKEAVADFVGRAAVAQRAAHVQLEFMCAVQRGN